MSIKSQCVNCKHYTSTDFCKVKGVLLYDGSHCQERVKRESDVSLNVNSQINMVNNKQHTMKTQHFYLKIFNYIYILLILVSFKVFPINSLAGYVLFLLIPFLLFLILLNITQLCKSSTQKMNVLFGILYFFVLLFFIYSFFNISNGKFLLLIVLFLGLFLSLLVFHFFKNLYQ